MTDRIRITREDEKRALDKGISEEHRLNPALKNLDASSNHAANLEGIDNTGAGRSQTTDSANLPAIPNSVTGCPHGCKTEADCLRYDQGGSIPSDCPLYATPNSVTIELERDKARYLAKLLRERCGDSDEERYLRNLIGEALS